MLFRSQAQARRQGPVPRGARLPGLVLENATARAVEGGADDAEWTIASSPEIVLLGDGDGEDSDRDVGWVDATPTKRKRRSS